MLFLLQCLKRKLIIVSSFELCCDKTHSNVSRKGLTAFSKNQTDCHKKSVIAGLSEFGVWSAKSDLQVSLHRLNNEKVLNRIVCLKVLSSNEQ